ncbi:outer membrane beta-barrel protein [Vibrio owensii]|uniref:outer membrane beta-barrel protein n=1 Tax=Vibrio owensii TaxID=696485 RepID=UPI003AAEB168
MKYYYLLVLIASLPSAVTAQDRDNTSTYYLKGGINSSFLDDNKKESEAFGLEAMIGYRVGNDIFLETGYQTFNLDRDDDLDLDALSIRTNWLMPVSEFADIYAGPGFSYINDGVSPSAQLGLQYQLSTNWVADVSYQGIFDINDLEDDLYSFNLSFLYRFPSSQPYVEEDVETIIPEPEIEQPVEVIPKPETCNLESKPYQLVKGDYLNKIAATNNVTLEDILDLNPQLKGRNINLVYPGETINYPVTVCN